MEGEYEELKTYERLAKTEEEDNRLEFSRQLGKIVRFGQWFQLKNVMTGEYLTASSTDAATLQVLNMAVSLTVDSAKS